MKKFLAVSLTLVMVLSLFSYAIPASNEQAAAPISSSLQIANEDKLIEMLKANGTIDKNASKAEIDQEIATFLASKKDLYTTKGSLAAYEVKREKDLMQRVANFTGNNGKGRKVGQAVTDVPGLVPEAFEGDQIQDKVLAVLVEFPNYGHNDVTAELTDLYYEDYTVEHYQDLLFGDFYEGPAGQEFISMKSYYEQQSGGAYSVDGQVIGWYEAEHDAEYYGNNDNEAAVRELVTEALIYAASVLGEDINDFDQQDIYDLDGDGNFREPDGLVDHIMIFHSSVGEEAGGGALGDDAIWSHSWSLSGPTPLGVASPVPYWGNQIAAYDYTIQPVDAAAGVCAHEYGHDLGLPDEYDTDYSGNGEPVSYWSIMSSGSWAGAIGGTEPTGFSPYAKMFFASSMNETRWFDAPEVTLDMLEEGPIDVLLDEAATKGTNYDGLRISLPDKVTVVETPYVGEGMYYSGSGNNLGNALSYELDLSAATTASLDFMISYSIEQDWDYGYVLVNGAPIETSVSTNENPYDQNFGYGITGHSNGWVPASADLSAYAGQVIELSFYYWTDGYVAENGFYVDGIQVTADDAVVLEDNDESLGTLEGFTISDGTVASEHFYLVEWRTHNGVDAGLGRIVRGASLMSFDPGMLVWYVDNYYDNNHVGYHPGQGYLGIVDADQQLLKWPGNDYATTKYQIHDAAFNVVAGEKMMLDYTALYGNKMFLTDNKVAPNPLFDDSHSYIDWKLPDGGKILPQYGLQIRVLGASEDGTVGLIQLSK